MPEVGESVLYEIEPGVYVDGVVFDPREEAAYQGLVHARAPEEGTVHLRLTLPNGGTADRLDVPLADIGGIGEDEEAAEGPEQAESEPATAEPEPAAEDDDEPEPESGMMRMRSLRTSKKMPSLRPPARRQPSPLPSRPGGRIGTGVRSNG